jgi:hypothetical protein
MRVEHGARWAELSDTPFTWGERNHIRDAAEEGHFFESFAVTLVSTLHAGGGFSQVFLALAGVSLAALAAALLLPRIGEVPVPAVGASGRV